MPSDRPSRTQRIALIGLLVNIGLALIKLIAGIVGHSGALIADAVESLADIAGSVVIWGGLHIGARPADEDHPYGHGKAEALAGLVVSCVLLAAGVGICVEAARSIRTPHASPEPWTLLVLLLVVVAKYTMYVIARGVAKREGSGAVAVDAAHHVSDAVTSLAAGVGIAIALFGERWFGKAPPGAMGWETADDWAALLAGFIIMFNALKLVRLPLRELMDTTTQEDLRRAVEPAREVALGIAGVRRIEKVFARKSGAAYWLDMHVQVEPLLPVREAHAIGGRVRAAIRSRVANVRDVLVHIEPYEAESEPDAA